MSQRFRVAIVGVTGYAGRELDRMLGCHPAIEVCARFASKEDTVAGAAVFDPERLCETRPDVVVLATDHEVSLRMVPELWDSGFRILDMSGAFRLKDPQLYVQWYGFKHPAPALLEHASYGLPEFVADSIRQARLVANPGCYATAAILPLLPLFRAGAVDRSRAVMIDGKSGVSGAGRKPTARTHFCEVSENIQVYGVFKHRHTPEIVTNLPGCRFDQLIFTPHLIPIGRGILNTIVLSRAQKMSVHGVLSDAYASSPFVRVLRDGQFPDVHAVTRTNGCHIGVATEGDTAVIVSTIDNLVKGAAGQAIQNLNLMLGCEHSMGLAA